MGAKSVIKDKFGGIRPMARALRHKSHTTVQDWWENGVIPAHRYKEVLAAAKREKIAIKPADLLPDGLAA